MTINLKKHIPKVTVIPCYQYVYGSLCIHAGFKDCGTARRWAWWEKISDYRPIKSANLTNKADIEHGGAAEMTNL